MMGIHNFLQSNEPELDDGDTEQIEVVTLPGAPLPTVTMISPTLVVHNVIRGSYVHRVMLANGYEEVDRA